MLVVNHLVLSLEFIEEGFEGSEVKSSEEFASGLIQFLADEAGMTGAVMIYDILEQSQKIIPFGGAVNISQNVEK